MIQNRIQELLYQYKQQKISRAIRYPQCRNLLVTLKRIQKKRVDKKKKFATTQTNSYLRYNNIRHQSVLMRKLGESDPQLQKNKITNIQIAIQKLDGLIIHP